jgi:riboflavin biosynthesis pyrimidine reductase
VNESPRVGAVAGIDELASFYADPPDGVRANMIFSADGAVAFGGRAGPLSCPVDQQLLRILRSFADVVLVGAGTARAENYGPVRLTDGQRAQRRREGRAPTPPIAVISRSGELPARLFDNPEQPPILLTCAQSAARRSLNDDQRQRLWVAGEESVEMTRALALLRAHGMHRILCEGGPTVLDELVEADAVAEICVTLAPKLAANQPVGQRLSARLSQPVTMRLEHALACDDYLFLKYRR